MYQIRDGNGKVYSEVEHPAMVFNMNTGVMIKIGEFKDMLGYHATMCKAYEATGFDDIASELAVAEIPNQEEIDKVFQITGYAKTLYEKMQSVNTAP